MKLPGLSFGKKENAILQGVQNHLSVVMQTVDEFAALVESSAQGDTVAAKTHLQGVLDGESKADAVHRDISMRIAQGAFFGGVREDMLNLLEQIDNIADSAKDASRIIGQEEQLDAFSKTILGSQSMKDFLTNLKGAVVALSELIAAFQLGKKEVLARIPKVEELEEAADINKVDVLRMAFRSGDGPNPISVIQMRDFVSIADDVADNAEDASDVVLVLIAKGYD